MKSKKVLSIVLAAAMLVASAGCASQNTSSTASSGASSSDAASSAESSEAASTEESKDVESGAEEGSGDESGEEPGEESGEEPGEDPGDDEVDDYTAESQRIYQEVLGEFYETYEKAFDCTNVSERYAYMAMAEAKLLESGVFVPLTTQGGRYAITRVAPYTVTPVLWGQDNDRFHNAVVTSELIKIEDRTAMKEKYKELKGTGTYESWVKEYLTGKGYTIKDTYNIPYSSDPVTWDALSTSLAADSEAIVNTFDGLMEYDLENELKPALAESYTVSDDGLTYTFKLRSGVKWVDSQGREVADLTADDFVAGMQHMLDAQGGLEFLVDGVIVNASEYINGEIDDMAQVGVKAVDDLTVEYTLTHPVSYFMTMLGYSIFAPMSRSYYESKGGKFGADYDDTAADYTYGKDPSSIAYCGPYLVTNATEKNTIVFSENPSYWNKDNINIKTLTWLFNGGDDPTKAYTDAKAGTIDGCSLTTATLKIAQEDGTFADYAYISSTNSTTYNGFVNLWRQSYSNFNDSTKVVSSMTDEQKERTDKAVLNKHFRLAVCFSFDKGAYNSQAVGEDIKYNSVRNAYVPGTFVTLEEDVTVDINGTSQTFKAGTNYGVILQAQLDADGSTIKAYDPTADDGLGSSDGFDGWYNPTAAKAEIEKAIEELKADGVEISKENPIYLDFPYPSNDEVFTNRANAVKQSIEAALDGAVIINLTECASYDEYYYSGYYTPSGAENNFSFSDFSGWGPDYGDPSTYLDTMLPDYSGYMTKAIGLF